ncbi:MAG: hypothetical protein KY455_10305 [Euryarchaeota archaeon]|nr:hypothetical protein [Euryarchaeota archaeon]
MVTMKSLVTLVLTALVLASSMAVVASDHKGGSGDDNGGPKDSGGKPDDAGSSNGSENAGGKRDDAGSSNGSDNAGGKRDDAGSSNGSEKAGGKPEDPGAQGGSEDSGGKPGDPGAQGGSEDSGGKPDDAGSPSGSENAGKKPDDPGAQSGPENAGGGADEAGPDSHGRAPAGNGPDDIPQGRDPPRSERGHDDTPGTTTDAPARKNEGQPRGPDRGHDTLRTQGGEPAPAPAIVEDADDGFRTERTVDSPRPRVDFDARAAELKLETDSETPGLTSRIDGLVEYLDENGNGAYDIGEPVLDRIPVRDLEPVIQHGVEGADTREVAYTLPGGGTLTLIFHLGTSGQVGAKYDILVVDHPFHDPESRLAIGVSAAVDGGVRLLEIDGQPAVAGQDGDDVAYLRWVTEAIVDGDTVPVGWSVHISHSETVESAIIYWSYPQGMRILHDPEVGITHLPPDLIGDAELFVYGLVLTGTTLLVGHEFRRRRAW